MVVSSNNKILLPDFIKIENHDITLVDKFKLLGFYVDNKLNLIWEVQNGNSSLLFSPIDEMKIIK